MSDIADDADRHTEYFLQESLNRIKRKTLQADGYCHYCQDEVGEKQLFCSGGDCRDDWDKEEKLRRISGK